MKIRYAVWLSWAISLGAIQAQQVGFIPGKSYQSSPVDVIDLQSGNIVLAIPLLSYKEKGLLPNFTVKLTYNAPSWNTVDVYGDIGGVTSTDTPEWSYQGTGVQVAEGPEQAYSLLSEQIESNTWYDGNGDPEGYYYTAYYLADSSGANHGVQPIDRGEGTTNGTNLIVSGRADSPVITDSKGLVYTTGCSTPACDQDIYSVRDPFGNEIAASITPGLAGILAGWSDSLGRSFPLLAPPNVKGGCSIVSFPSMGSSPYSLTSCYSVHNLYSGFQTPGYIEGATSVEMLDSVSLPDGTSYGFFYGSRGELSSITLPTGGMVSYKYIWKNNEESMTPLVVSRSISDGVSTQVWKYGYVNGTTVTDPNLNDTFHVFDGSGAETDTYTFLGAMTNVNPNDGCYGVTSVANLTEVIHKTMIGTGGSIYGGLSETPLSETTTWSDGSTSKTTYTPDESGVWWNDWATSYPGGWSYPSPMSYGSTLQQQDYDFGHCAPGPLLRTTNTVPLWQNNALYLAANIMDVPYSTQVLDGNGKAASLTTYGYDEAGSPQGQYGNQTSVTSGLSDISPLVKTQAVFNASGMVTKTLDAKMNATEIAYDGSGLYPQSITHPLTGTIAHVDQYVYNDVTGQMSSHTDENMQTTRYTYDAETRLRGVQTPDVGTSSLSQLYCYPNATTTVTVMAQGSVIPLPSGDTDCPQGGNVVVTTKTVDGLGRVVSRQTNSDVGVIEQDTKYDPLGRTYSVSNPYRLAPLPTDPPRGSTLYLYDELGRPKTKQAVDASGNDLGTTKTINTGNIVDFYDETKRHWRRVSDALGRLTSVQEPDQQTGALSALTSYTYDALGNLTLVNGAPAKRRFKYDSLSRLTYSCNPETLSQGSQCDGSTWSFAYTYDLNGNVHTKTDARAITTTFSYDSLNRLLGKTYSSTDPNAGSLTAASTPSSCYEYDLPTLNTSGFTSGRLTAEWTAYGNCSGSIPATGIQTSRLVSYDNLGRVFTEQQCTPANCSSAYPSYSLSYGYDYAGHLASWNNGLAGSQAITLGNGYNSAGRLSSVKANTPWNDVLHPSQLFGGLSYTPGGQLEQWTLGNNLSLSRSYDAKQQVTNETATGQK